MAVVDKVEGTDTVDAVPVSDKEGAVPGVAPVDEAQGAVGAVQGAELAVAALGSAAEVPVGKAVDVGLVTVGEDPDQVVGPDEFARSSLRSSTSPSGSSRSELISFEA